MAESVTDEEESTPVAEFSVILGGNDQLTTEKVVAPPAPPVVWICAEYGIAGDPVSVGAFGKVVVVIASGPFTCNVNCTVVDCGDALLSIIET